MKQVVIMPGGFHPFHAGHYALYQQAQKAFPGAEVFVAATNDTSSRPFPFALKEKLAQLAGVAPGHFVQVKSPFQAAEITANLDPANTQLIFVRSEKDADKPPRAGGVKKDGNPAYLQPYAGNENNPVPMNRHAFMAYLPTVEFGPGFTSATEIRNAWPTLNEKRKTALVMSLYPKTQTNPALAANVVKMLDTAMGSELDEGEVVQFPKKHKGDISNMHSCPKCGGDLQGGKYMGHQVQVCMPCKQVYLPPNSGIDQKGNKIENEAISRRGILKGLGAAAAAGAAGKASAIAGAFPTPSQSAAMYKAAADSNRAEAKRQTELKAKADAERLQKNTELVDKEQRVNHHKLDEFAPSDSDDGLPQAEYQVYQCQPDDQFEWIGGPLMQTDDMGKAHNFAYFLWKKHPNKCFMIWQERSQGSRGGYGPKGSVLAPSEEELNEFAPDGFDGFEDDNRVPMHCVVEKDRYNRRSKWKKSRDADGVILFSTKQQAIQAAEKFNKIDPNREFAYGGTQMVHVDDDDENLNEFAPDEGGGARKFIPWTEFIEQVKQIVGKDFDCVENVVKTTIKARFVPHDPMEFGPTMLYSYYETRAGRNKGAISTRGSIQVGKYTKGGLFGQNPDQLLTGFHLLKGHPFERHFDLTFDNIYKIANIIQGNTEGALEFKPEVAEETSGPVEAYGYAYNRRDQRVMWRKTFPSAEAAYAWADSKNATVLGTRPVQQTVDEDYIDEKY